MFFADNGFDSMLNGMSMRSFLAENLMGHTAMDEESFEPPERHIEVPVTLEQCYRGANVSIPLERLECCRQCKGKGGKKSQQGGGTCRPCNGEGHVVHEFHMGRGMVQQSIGACDRCDGKGYRIKNRDRCTSCDGGQVVRTNIEVSFDIPPGTRNKSEIRLGKEGDVSKSYPQAGAGELVAHCILQPHETFRVQKNNLIVSHEVSWAEAITGAAVVVEHLDGRRLFVEINEPIVQNGERRVIQGAGMPVLKTSRGKWSAQSGQFGDLIIEFSVRFPEKLPVAALQRLQQVIGDECVEADVDIEAEEVCMVKVPFDEAQRAIQHSEKKYGGGRREEERQSTERCMPCGVQ